jgi:hypothetical protein
MLVFSLRLEKEGHEAVTAWTSHTDIHDYQRRGPDPDMALWKSSVGRRRQLAAEVARRV